MNEATPEQPTVTKYENNPFLLALNGIQALFALAKPVAIFFLVLSVLNVLSGLIDTGSPSDSAASERETDEFIKSVQSFSTDAWITIGVVAVVVFIGLFVIGAIINGIADYTASRLAKGKKSGLKEAFSATIKRLGGYLWLKIIVAVKTFLWSLLFVVPGIVMSYRYSLAGVAFFAEDIKAHESVKRSLVLTKGAWLTTFASQTLFNLITLGFIAPLLMPGTLALLYRQFTAQPDQKPAAHILSWLTLIIPIILAILLVLGLLLLAAALSNYMTTAP